MEVWQKAKSFSVDLYRITDNGSFNTDFALKDQLRRASVSVLSNIAEGFERNGNKAFIYFLKISKGSAGEVRAQLHIAYALGYVSRVEFEALTDQITLVSKMLSGFIAYLKQLEK